MSDHKPNNDSSNNNLDPDSGNEGDIEYDTRCSRRNENYHHQHLSALFPAQRMEQAVYYDTVKIFAEISLYLLRRRRSHGYRRSNQLTAEHANL